MTKPFHETDVFEFSCVIEPSVFRALEHVCREAISYSGNHQSVRRAVTDLVVMMKRNADNNFGHDTPDIVALTSLLHRTHPDESTRAVNKAQHAMVHLTKVNALTSEQLSSCHTIERVWLAWGRCLSVAGRSYEGSGTAGKSKAISPIDIMGEEIWNLWREHYKPWYSSACKLRVVGGMTEAQLVFAVVIEGTLPSTLDSRLKLEEGTTLQALKRALDGF